MFFSYVQNSFELNVRYNEKEKLPLTNIGNDRTKWGAAKNIAQPGFYQEVMNTDSATYGGSNTGNMGGAQSVPIPHMGRQHSIALTLPPLAATFLKWLPS